MIQSDESAMNLQRDGDWIIYKTDDQKVFYYNDKTNQFQWNSPFEAESREVEEVQAVTDLQTLADIPEESNTSSDQQGYTQQDVVSDYTGAVEQALNQPLELPDFVLASDWRPYLDQDSGVTFWYNHATEQSQWESPFEGYEYGSETEQTQQLPLETTANSANSEVVITNLDQGSEEIKTETLLANSEIDIAKQSETEPSAETKEVAITETEVVTNSQSSNPHAADSKPAEQQDLPTEPSQEVKSQAE